MFFSKQNGKEKKRIPKIGEWAIGHSNSSEELEPSNVDVAITLADFKKDKCILI
jgi:hypothetical protein